jgi:hypothetical protein
MMKTPIFFALAFATACSFHARNPETYRADTQALLESKTPEIKACYDGVLKNKSDAAGTVKVKFKVQEETGKIFEAQVDPSGTTAPSELADCVVKTIDGIQLAPPDANEGIATYTWDFKAEPAAAAPAAPAEPSAPAAPAPAPKS